MAEEKPHPLVRELTEPSPSRVYDIKRRNQDGSVEVVKFRVRLLRPAQSIDALVAAQEYATRKGEAKGYGDIYKEAQVHELLQRSLCHVEIGERNGKKFLRPIFVDADQLRDSLDEAECAQLINCYSITKSYFGLAEEFDDAKLETYIERLSNEMGGPYFLSLVDSSDWPQLIFSLARSAQSSRQSGSQTHSSSPSTSESNHSSSETGTTGFSALPSAHLSDLPNGEQLPTDHYLTPDESRDIARRNPIG
jgi:hypothetical protein